MEYCSQTFNSPSTSSVLRTENASAIFLSSPTSEKLVVSEEKTYLDISTNVPAVWMSAKRTYYAQPVIPSDEAIDLSRGNHRKRNACRFSHLSKDVEVEAGSSGRPTTPNQVQHRVPLNIESTKYLMQHEHMDPQSEYNQNAFYGLENSHHHPQAYNSGQPQLNFNSSSAAYFQGCFFGNTVPSAPNPCSTSSMSSNANIANGGLAPKETTTLRNPSYPAECHNESSATIKTGTDDNVFKVSLPGGQTLFSVPLLPTKGNLLSNSSTLNYSQVNKKPRTLKKKKQDMLILRQNESNTLVSVSNNANTSPNVEHLSIFVVNSNIAQNHLGQSPDYPEFFISEASNLNPNQFYSPNGFETVVKSPGVLVDETRLHDIRSANYATHSATEVILPNTSKKSEEILRSQADLVSFNATKGRILNYIDKPVLQKNAIRSYGKRRKKILVTYDKNDNQSTRNKDWRSATSHMRIVQTKTNCNEVDARVMPAQQSVRKATSLQFPTVEVKKDVCSNQENRWVATHANESGFPVTNFAVSTTYQTTSFDMPDLFHFNTNLASKKGLVFSNPEKISKKNRNTRTEQLVDNSSRSLRNRTRTQNDLCLYESEDELEIEAATMEPYTVTSPRSHKTTKQSSKIVGNDSISSQLINIETDVEMEVRLESTNLKTHNARSASSSWLPRDEISSRFSPAYDVRISTECNVQVEERQTPPTILSDINNPLNECSDMPLSSDTEGELQIDESVVDSGELL